jgi:hypothetical protein
VIGDDHLDRHAERLRVVGDGEVGGDFRADTLEVGVDA